MTAEGPDLSLVHRIDQAQAGAFQRISNLLEWVSDWLNNQGFSDDEIRDALDNPMIFMTLVKILEQRVSAHEYPNMLSAAIIRLAKFKFEGE